MTEKPLTQTGRLRLSLALALGLAPFLLWLSISLVMRLPVAHAADLTVCLEGTPFCTYTSIQAAVDAANPGDVIKVAAGTYTGTNTYGGTAQVVYISKTLTIQGGYTTTDNFGGSPDPVANPTTLDALGGGRVMVLTGNITPTVEGLGITGGDAYLLGGFVEEIDSGGGIYIYGATATISNCTIYSNTASSGSIGAGGGLSLISSLATLIGNTVTGNTASSAYDGWGGGLALYDSDATLDGNTITDNTASSAYDGWGGGLALVYSDATLESNTVQENTASSAAWGNGGGIYLEDSPATLIGNQVISNTASSAGFGEGGGIYSGWNDFGVITLTGNTVCGNTASSAGDGYGGGINLTDSPAILTDNMVTNNTASSVGDGAGGGVYIDYYIEMFNPTAILSGNTVQNNIASTAGFGEGGGLWLSGGYPFTLTRNTVISNTASTADIGYGGGIYLIDSTFTLEGNTIHDNTASDTDDGFGGGIHAEYNDTTTFKDNTIVSNTATLSTTATGQGGGMWTGYLWYGSLTMINNLVADNHANTAGSGLYIASDYDFAVDGRLLHNTIAHNHSSGQGVFVEGTGATLAFSNTIIAGHTNVGITATDSSAILTLESTLWHNNGLDVGGAGTIISSTNVYGNPAFADPASRDYHLTMSSMAIDAGLGAGVTTDFEGDSRPQGDGFDIGYDESPFTIQADVAIAKSVTPGIVAPNQAVTYTLTFTNTGPHPALGVLITDAIPITLTNVSYTNAGAAITPTGSFSYTWEVTNLAPGQGGVITITGMVTTSVNGVLDLYNQAEITTTINDPTPLNNISTVSSTIDAEPPAPPTLVSPADDSIINSNTPTLTWSASPSTDVAGYLLDLNGTLTDVGNVINFTTAVLANGTYTWTLAAYDDLGNIGAYTDTWSFTIDTVAPTIIAVAPANGTFEVATTASVEITFSEPIDADSFSFTVTPDPGGWSIAWSGGGTIATLSHAPFTGDTTYTFRVTTAGDPAGNSLAQAPYEWSFTTAAYRTYLPLVMRAYVIAPDLVVERIIATENDIQVVIKNQGNETVVDNFWVDVYIDPDPAPTHVNQLWSDLAAQGLVWGVSADLAPGEILTLTVDGDYYNSTYSNVTWPLTTGTEVYAQVDSYSSDNTYGNIREIDEIRREPYNNIGHVAVPAGSSSANANSTPELSIASGHSLTPSAKLPPRPKKGLDRLL
jgi:uncharacterized repeat protein (TIGR01451 family)